LLYPSVRRLRRCLRPMEPGPMRRIFKEMD
jgi:hypothetical protein